MVAFANLSYKILSASRREQHHFDAFSLIEEGARGQILGRRGVRQRVFRGEEFADGTRLVQREAVREGEDGDAAEGVASCVLSRGNGRV
jgi:hypothetical protein